MMEMDRLLIYAQLFLDAVLICALFILARRLKKEQPAAGPAAADEGRMVKEGSSPRYSASSFDREMERSGLALSPAKAVKAAKPQGRSCRITALEMAAKGYDPEQIAERLGMALGEVELLLALSASPADKAYAAPPAGGMLGSAALAGEKGIR